MIDIKEEKIVQSSCEKYFIKSFFIIFAGFFVYFLAFYPGVLSKDSISQMQQILGISPASNHHPWIHTQLIGICYQIGVNVFGSRNAGVATYSLVSILILSVSFAAICV